MLSGRRGVLLLILLLTAIVLPPYLGVYHTRFATQIAIYGMAALSVDLLLGYTGLITFGQAALFGVGAYAAGMLTVFGITNAFVVWPLAVLISMLFALFIGSLSLRTRGFQFIMVTLAFAQMVYYFAQSLRNWGGDDGFTLPQRDHLGFLSLANHTTFYYVVLGVLVSVLALSDRLVKSQFGMTIRGIRDNERRAAAIGFPPYPYKLVIFVIAGGIAGLAGALMANHARFVSPSIASWQMSGELLAMVILGSANSLIGPVIGAAFFLAFRDVLSDFTEHWMLFFGPLLVGRVLLMREGIWGLVVRLTGAEERRNPLIFDIPETSDNVAGSKAEEQRPPGPRLSARLPEVRS
jgi:branched-chain amino acid transport system permease protein